MGIITYGKGFTETMSMSEIRSGENHLPPVLAVDFDGTLVEDKYPNIGRINTTVWNAVLNAQNKGYKLIFWSCRNGEALEDAVSFCAHNGLHFDAINENIDEVKVLYGGDTRKVFADIYLDDRSCVINSVNGFTTVGCLEKS